VASSKNNNGGVLNRVELELKVQAIDGILLYKKCSQTIVSVGVLVKRHHTNSVLRDSAICR